MKRIVLPLAVFLSCALPAAAQDEDGSSKMDQALQLFLEGLLLEMEPAMENMRAFLKEMGPAMAELLNEVKDWSAYEPPEILENGDIIIRRKPDRDTEPDPSQDRQPLPQIEL